MLAVHWDSLAAGSTHSAPGRCMSRCVQRAMVRAWYVWSNCRDDDRHWCLPRGSHWARTSRAHGAHGSSGSGYHPTSNGPELGIYLAIGPISDCACGYLLGTVHFCRLGWPHAISTLVRSLHAEFSTIP